MSGEGYLPIRVERSGGVVVLDQTLLPHQERYLHIETVDAMCEAITSLRVRGAPLLGLCGMAGMAIAGGSDASDAGLEEAARQLTGTRPTAVDLGAGVKRAEDATRGISDSEGRRAALWELAASAAAEQYATDDAIARHGAGLLEGADAVLTHCNTGALATGGRGTALAVIAEAFERGYIERCYATETRPLLQGARLTTWELAKLGIPCTLLPDTAAPTLIAAGKVGAVITGADRIAANGDTANKVGTYGLALAAKAHGVPFYVAAPRTTLDLACPDGAAIPIEMRDAGEVGGFGGDRWSPAGIDAYNPAFDVTPAALIAAIVTDAGVARHRTGSRWRGPANRNGDSELQWGDVEQRIAHRPGSDRWLGFL